MYTFVFFLFFVVVYSKDLPPNFPKCYRDWPIEKFDDCMIKATEILKPILRKGVKKLGFPSLNPLVLPEVTLEQEGNTAAYRAYVTNFALYGLDNYNFKKIHFDWKKHYAVVEVDFDNIYATGIYVFNGKLLQIPLNGEGDFKANISKTHSVMEQWSREEMRNGTNYLHHFKYVLHLDLGQVTSHSVEGLFKDNEVLSRATQKTIKENIEEIIDTLKPAIVEVIISLFKNVYFKEMDSIPYDNLFPISKK